MLNLYEHRGRLCAAVCKSRIAGDEQERVGHRSDFAVGERMGAVSVCAVVGARRVRRVSEMSFDEAHCLRKGADGRDCH